MFIFIIGWFNSSRGSPLGHEASGFEMLVCEVSGFPRFSDDIDGERLGVSNDARVSFYRSHRT